MSAFQKAQDLLSARFLHLIGLASCRRLIAFDVVARNENSVGWYEVARLEMKHIADQDVVNGDGEGFARANDFYVAGFLLCVEANESPVLLAVRLLAIL